ncbi:MFS transporter [Wohlfahrtiimonas populi]|uniref:MFS transporter n=1 Tax=Wohlfahrtiimonas populi TaxID=1940240 RepID=UPI00098D387B|nr:MFS transporter [Wohlfahrtiimonas populi]
MSYRYQLAIVFLLGFFLDCLNIFMSVMALPAISVQMQLSANEITWISHAYILGLTLIMPLSHWFANLIGASKLLTLSMLIFALASFACGMSGDVYSLMLARFIQGIGGGLMIPLGQALVFQAFSLAERSKISTMIMAIALIAPAFSPSLGGMIVDVWSWHWVFWVNVPLAIVTALLAWFWVKDSATQKIIKPDWIGLGLISFSLLLVLTALTQYGLQNYSVFIHLALFIGITLFVIYYRYSRNSVNALVDLSLLRNRRLNVSVAVYYAVPGVFMGVNFLAIFYLQNILGFSATQTGQMMLLYAMGAFGAMLFSGRFYNQMGAKKLLSIGLIIHSLGIGTLYGVDQSHTLIILIPAYLLMGIGGGVGANAAQTTALLDFKDDELLKGSVLWNINRQVTFCIGLSVLTLMFSLWQLIVPIELAYTTTFLSAAMIGIVTLFMVRKLPS